MTSTGPVGAGPDNAIREATSVLAEGSFTFADTRVSTATARGLDPWKSSAAFLARVTGEGQPQAHALRRLELRWTGRPDERPQVLIRGTVGCHDPEAAIRVARSYRTEVGAALADLAPTRWRSLDADSVPETTDRSSIARLHLAPATDQGPDAVIYPLWSETIERTLERVSNPTSVSIELLVFPRRQLPPNLYRHDLYARPVGGVGVENRPDARTAGHVDPADRWHFAARVEVWSDGPLPSQVLSAIAADIRGTGYRNIDTVLSGRASPVDAEWVIVIEPGTEHGAPQTAAPGDWPASVPRLNLREAACLFALPVGGRTGPAIPEDLRLVPDAVPASGWLLGTAHDGRRMVGVAEVDRTRHVYICGRTGCGKTTMLTHLAAQDLRDERRIVVILDPHGSFGEAVAALVPASRIDDVVFIDPADALAPVGFNPIALERPEDLEPVIDLWVAIMKEVHEPNGYNLVFGPIAERVFRALLGTVMSVSGSTFVDAMELLANPSRWREYEPHIRLRSVRTYWQQWLSTSSKEDSEQMPYLASKFSPLVDNLAVRRLVDQPRSTFTFGRILEQGGIVIVVLDRSSVGPVASGFITRMFLHYLMRAVMQRGPATAASRPVSLYIDEVQNVAGPIIQAVLAEGRKWGLSAVLANQHSAQLPDSLVHAIAGNVGTVISYGVSVHDAPMMARMLGGDASLAEALSRLPNYRALVGTSPGGEPQPPFLLESPAPTTGFSREQLDQVRRASRKIYGGVVRGRDQGPVESEPQMSEQTVLFDGQ